MIKAITFIILIIFINIIISPALAAEATPSSDLKVKLKVLQDSIASRAAQLKTEVSKRLQNKAYVGVVKSQSKDAITLATNKGTRLININEYTQYAGTKSKTAREAAVDDYIVALGDVDDTSVLTAKKIIKLPPTKEVERKSVFGEVISLENTTITITTRQNQNVTVSTDKDTVFKTANGQEMSVDEIKLNKPIIAFGTSSKEGVLEAKFIYIIPYTANFKPKIVTTLSESSSRSATPSGKTATKSGAKRR